MRYDPDISPPAAKWLALDEDERVALIEQFHRRARVELPDAQIHAAIHATVETQLAMDLPSVSDALRRLQLEGLDRHEAIHAIGAMLTEQMWLALQEKRTHGNFNDSYYAALDRLSAESWRREFGEEPNDSSGQSTLSSIQQRQAEQLLAPFCHVPPHVANEVRIGFRLEGPSIILFESRPAFMNPREWQERPVAKFRYFKRRAIWRLYCQFRDLKWHAYEPLPESPDLESLVVEVRKDLTAIFWG